MRVRAKVWVFEALRELSPVEVGDLLASALQARQEVSSSPEQQQTPTPPPSRVSKLSARAAALYEALAQSGAVLVEVGNRYEVRRGEAVLFSVAGSTAGSLQTRGLVRRASSGVWVRSDLG